MKPMVFSVATDFENPYSNFVESKGLAGVLFRSFSRPGVGYREQMVCQGKSSCRVFGNEQKAKVYGICQF